MKFRTAVLGGVVSLVAAMTVVAVATVASILERDARRTMTESLVRSATVFDDQYEYRQSLFAAQADVVAEEPRLKAAVATESITRATVLDICQEMQRALGSDLFLLADGRGRLIADTAAPDAAGFDLADKPIVAAALAEGRGAGIWTHDDRVYQMQARDMRFGETVVGVLVIGYAIDTVLAETVSRQTGSSVVIELDGTVIATGGDGVSAGTSLPEVEVDLDVPIEIDLGGRRHLALASTMPGYLGERDVRFTVLRSLDDALAAAQRLIQLLYLIAAGAMAMAVVVAIALARRLAAPLEKLVRFTSEIAAGNLEAQRIVAGPHEVQTLGRAMNRMVGELAESRVQLALTQRLEREMEIASKIQTSILPTKPMVDGLEIAARMVTADEVGGDYYDVVPVDGGCWLGIGDVAGHGLPAGLEMLMTQSAVAALCRQAPDATPSHLLGTLNAVLFNNIRNRLDQHEHVTLTLLRYYADGRIKFAGAHEDIIVWSAGKGCVQIQTQGTWLAAVDSIESITVDDEFSLAGGDVLLLHTDGITEATNAAGEQFGLGRLCEALEAAHDQPVEIICSSILEVLNRWMTEQLDDISLLVARRVPPSGP